MGDQYNQSTNSRDTCRVYQPKQFNGYNVMHRFSATSPSGKFKKLTRRKSTSEALQRPQPKSPTGYDWQVPQSPFNNTKIYNRKLC